MFHLLWPVSICSPQILKLKYLSTLKLILQIWLVLRVVIAVTVQTLMAANAQLKGMIVDHWFLPVGCRSLGNARIVAINYDF